MAKVTVIVPVYNTASYLKKCMDSLINQTLDDVEIIVVEDCSTDNSREILKEYEKYSNVRVYYNKKNMGIGYSRNFGIEKATGEYIAFIDSDDFVDYQMMEKMYNKAESDRLDMVICRFHKLEEQEKGKFIELEPKFKIPNFDNTTLANRPDLLVEINSAIWNKLYNATLFSDKTVRFPENLKYEDAIFIVKAMVKSKKIGMLEDKLNYYLVRNNSQSTVMDEKVFDILIINDLILKELRNQKYYENIKKVAERKIIKSLSYWVKQQQYQENKEVACRFKNEAINYLDNNIPNWQSFTK